MPALIRDLMARRRHARRLAAARRAIRQAERACARKRGALGPGYSELASPAFVALLLVALLATVTDLRGLVRAACEALLNVLGGPL